MYSIPMRITEDCTNHQQLGVCLTLDFAAHFRNISKHFLRIEIVQRKSLTKETKTY